MKQRWKQEILKILKDGPKTTKQIAEKLNKSPSYVRKLLSELRKEGLIESVDLGVTKEHCLTRKAKLLFENDGVLKARVHNIRVVCHVLQADYKKIAEVGKEIKMNNWRAYLVNLKSLTNLNNVPDAKIRFNIAKNVTAILFLPSFYASDKWEAAREIHNMFQKVRRALQLNGILLDEDWMKMKCIYGEYAFEIDIPLDPGHEIRLGRNAKDPMNNELPTEARVWVDESEGREIETNDADYTHKYLMMPEYVAEIYQDFKKFGTFLSKFERVLEKQSEVLEKQNENLTKSTELQLAFAENLASHIPYTQAATTAQKEMTKALSETTNLVKLLQKHQQMFFITMLSVIVLLIIGGILL